MKKYALSIVFLFLMQSSIAQWAFRCESGIVFPGYNNVSIPGNSGTRFSLVDDLKTSAKLYYRINTIVSLAEKHQIKIVYAPLRIRSEGSLSNDIVFMNTIFPQNTNISSVYKFNSYRLTYRYLFRSDKLHLGIGLTGKIRDAKIALSNEVLQDKKTDLGFVPLIHFMLRYRIRDKWAIHFEADALGAKQGRAEDLMLALEYVAFDKLDFFTGYRILEGGSDGSSVYTFALFHYMAFGFHIRI